MIAIKDLKAGQEVTESDLTFKRPAYGISPRSIDELVGKRVLNDIPEDTVLQWNMFEWNLTTFFSLAVRTTLAIF